MRPKAAAGGEGGAGGAGGAAAAARPWPLGRPRVTLADHAGAAAAVLWGAVAAAAACGHSNEGRSG